MELEFDRSTAAMGSVLCLMLEHLDQRYTAHMYLPVQLISPRLAFYSAAIASRGACFDTCWGFLDATCRRIARPSKQQRAFYSGYKKMHRIKFQDIVCLDGLCVHVFGPIEGSRHDMTLVHRSNLLSFMKETKPFKNYMFYADKSYTQTPQLI
jgi:hypothetical protein